MGGGWAGGKLGARGWNHLIDSSAHRNDSMKMFQNQRFVLYILPLLNIGSTVAFHTDVYCDAHDNRYNLRFQYFFSANSSNKSNKTNVINRYQCQLHTESSLGGLGFKLTTFSLQGVGENRCLFEPRGENKKNSLDLSGWNDRGQAEERFICGVTRVSLFYDHFLLEL